MTSDMVTGELKPCPFCGDDEELRVCQPAHMSGYWVAHCGCCGGEMQAETEGGAVAGWNTRTPIIPVADAIAELRYIDETPTPEQRERARASDIYRIGDLRLVWINEGDLVAALARRYDTCGKSDTVADFLTETWHRVYGNGAGWSAFKAAVDAGQFDEALRQMAPGLADRASTLSSDDCRELSNLIDHLCEWPDGALPDDLVPRVKRAHAILDPLADRASEPPLSGDKCAKHDIWHPCVLCTAPASHREGSEAVTDAMIEAGAKAIYDLRKESACNGQRPAEWEELDDIWQEEERSFARAALTAMSGQSQPITRELAAMSSSKPIGAVADSASGSPLSGEPNGQAGADHASGSRSGEGSEAITDAMLQAGLKELDWYDGEKGEEVVEAVYTAMRQAALQSSPVPDGAITPEVGAALDHALRASTKLIETIPPRNADEVERVAQLLHYKETVRNYGQQTADQVDWAEEPDSIRQKYRDRATDAITGIRPSRVGQ